MSAIKPHLSPFYNLLNRRNFLKLMAHSGLLSCFPSFSFAVLDEIYLPEKSLALFNPRTKERFEGNYYRHGDYDADALNIINHIMRDIRTDDVKIIDTNLLDIIFAISIKLNPSSDSSLNL